MEARISEVLIGRHRELHQLERALAGAVTGAGATILVAGEAGIGKSRLGIELARRARDAGFEVLVGHSIELDGTELPYQPFVKAIRPLDRRWHVEASPVASQSGLFEALLALLVERAATAPLLLVLEDLHWADSSTLDLVVFLTHNITDQPILIFATCRDDDAVSAERIGRLIDRVRHAGSSLVIELGPLERHEVIALVEARASTALPSKVVDMVVSRAEGNPFFAEELAAAAGDGDIPRGLRGLLLRRVAGLDQATQHLLRVASAAGREVGYRELSGAASHPEPVVRESLRLAVDHGVLVADQAAGTFRFRHALLAHAIYATVLPGEREELHARLAQVLAAAGAPAAELAPHWAAAGRSDQALAASLVAAREAEAVFGLPETLVHLERAVALWHSVADASAIPTDLASLCAWTAEVASRTGAAPRAVELVRQAIDLVGSDDPRGAAHLHVRLGRYLFESGAGDTFLAPLERALELVTALPPCPERAEAVEAVGGGLQLLWRYQESFAYAEQALALARATRSREVEFKALITLGIDLAYLGHGDEGMAHLDQARSLATAMCDPLALYQAYVALTDTLTMLGRPRQAAADGEEGLTMLRPYGIDHTVLTANWIEALLAIGEWDAADDASSRAVRAITASYPHMPLILRADLETGRGHFDEARAHLDAARVTVRHEPGLATYYGYVAELALSQHQWRDALDAVDVGLEPAFRYDAALISVWLCAKGLRATAELAALARAHHDNTGLDDALARAAQLIAVVRDAAAAVAAITPNAAGWSALAEAENARTSATARAAHWGDAADAWDQLERPPIVAYCRWRQAEMLLAEGAGRVDAGSVLREAHAVAIHIGARPLLHQIERLAQAGRLDLTPPPAERAPAEPLGITPREAQVLALVARGYSDREIAAALVISPRTASVHVSHILHKLNAPNRLEAATIAHLITPRDSEHELDA